MKIIRLFTLILLTACGSNVERVKSPELQKTNSDNLASRALELAKIIDQQQQEAQPNSWDVSSEESRTKENPLTPPVVVLNSGVPPNLVDGRPPLDAGLWNCQKLKSGQLILSR